MKTVKRAVVRVVKGSELREGDAILWANVACRVTAVIRGYARRSSRVLIELPDSTPAKIPMYRHFYVVEEVLEYEGE